MNDALLSKFFEIKQIALDIHGVIDTNPVYFSFLTKSLKEQNWDVHILTGTRLTDGKIVEWLKNNNINYSYLFSISDYLKQKGCKELEGSTEFNPLFCDEEWNRAKAKYCLENNIQLCLDDNNAYFEHFKTPIARYYSKGYKKGL
jgi:hypothetical protein